MTYAFYIFLVYLWYNKSMFEWDNEKNQKNIEKHKISFREAQTLWDDPYGIILKARTIDSETRELIVAQYNTKIWSCIYTFRNSTVRIISARRARIKEVELYENNKINL